jgi:hypothetical protein
MGTELVPETLYSNELTRLCVREDYIKVIMCLKTRVTLGYKNVLQVAVISTIKQCRQTMQ